MNLLRTNNALNLQDFLEHFELTLLRILHPRYNSILAENRMGYTFLLKITDKASYIQHLDRSLRPPWMVEVPALQEQYTGRPPLMLEVPVLQELYTGRFN